MKRRISSSTRLFAIVMTAATVTYGANQAPVVNAGSDQLNVSLKGFNRLSGTVSDDSTAFESLVITWTQLSGKPAILTVPDFPNTTVEYPDTGRYVFELKASDGVLTSADTITVHVRPSLPFKVLAPVENESVEIGKSYMVRWQMDPSKPCMVHLSHDEGLTWQIISEVGSVSDSLLWQVDSDFIAGTKALLRVQEYQVDSNSTQCTILFAKTNIETAGSSSGCGTGAGLALLPPIGFRLAAKRRKLRAGADMIIA